MTGTPPAARAPSDRATPGRATHAAGRGPLSPVVDGPRCGWPGHCKQPDDWHTPEPGTRRGWGWHDVQCQRAAADPDLLPTCGLINNHAGECACSPRLTRRRRQA
jgi:hypothetical protein